MGQAIKVCGASDASFVVGQDADGRWVAVEIHGRGGGLFSSRVAALRYAAFETDHRPQAVRMSAGHLRLPL